MSAKGDALRRRAEYAADASRRASKMAGQLLPLGSEIVKATHGYEFEGPFANEVRVRVASINRQVDVASQVLTEASVRLASAAALYEMQAKFEDVRDALLG